MNTYSLKDLKTIWSAKSYLPYERFMHHFTLRYGYTEKQAIEAYKLFSEFPKSVYGSEELQLKVDKIIPLAISLVDELHKCWDMDSKITNIRYDEKDFKKLIYLEKEDEKEYKEVVLDFNHTSDILTYADLIKRGVVIVSLLRFCCDVQMKNTDKKLLIFEGDIFNTNDFYFGVKSNVYVAESKGTFKKLIYTKGKGYLRKGDLNYDEGSFNSYALTLNEWNKIGNTVTDFIKLTDDGDAD
jgi:hypothetical protein